MEAARIQPEPTGFVNAIQQYPYTEGALYQVYAKPGQVTDIALQEGEQLVGTGPVAAGDTVRWMIGDTVSGVGPTARVHILVKPVRPDITTNLIINTDRRTPTAGPIISNYAPIRASIWRQCPGSIRRTS